VLDPQAQVYSDLQALLSQAITNLGGAGPGPGPGTFDLAYGGNTAKWIEAANTLKARLYMHTVELDNNQIDNGALNNAITYALLGISSAANDFKSRHTSQPGEDNMWYQFNFRSGFGQYVVAGRALADIMVARNDPRLGSTSVPPTPGRGSAGRIRSAAARRPGSRCSKERATHRPSRNRSSPTSRTS